VIAWSARLAGRIVGSRVGFCECGYQLRAEAMLEHHPGPGPSTAQRRTIVNASMTHPDGELIPAGI
jgi:hypothetical protein